MASNTVCLFVLFQLLTLNVVSQISAFPTPTASADGELSIASNRERKNEMLEKTGFCDLKGDFKSIIKCKYATFYLASYSGFPAEDVTVETEPIL